MDTIQSNVPAMAWSLLLSFLVSLLTRLLLVVDLQNWSVTVPASRRVETSKEVCGILRTYGISCFLAEWATPATPEPSWMEIPISEATLQHYSRPNRCSSLLLAPLLHVCMLHVEQCFLGSHPVYPSSPGLRHQQWHQPYVILLILQTGVLLGWWDYFPIQKQGTSRMMGWC
jgi:hypothetical protein